MGRAFPLQRRREQIQAFPGDIPAARMVADPYPAFNGIAVDPEKKRGCGQRPESQKFASL